MTGYELTVADNIQISPDAEYVPFRRSDAVLSPSNAQEASPISREHTQAALAREAYYKNMQPAQYGVHMHNIKDSHQRPPKHTTSDSTHSKVLLTNSAVVIITTVNLLIVSWCHKNSYKYTFMLSL